MDEKGKAVIIIKNGPYRVTGGVRLDNVRIVGDGEGGSIAWEKSGDYPRQESFFLCRCGASRDKPFCDGSHAKIAFDGTEQADNIPYAESCRIYKGDGMALMDKEVLCAIARYCDPHGQVWNLIMRPEDRELAIEEACSCPAGRLTIVIDGEIIEPKLPRDISLIDDRPEGKLGPIWVKGGIPVIGAEGVRYEPRNRVTLCRCGQSRNKPFCDGAHLQDEEADDGE
ncbi:MAG: CDGSH iron-sulfur domain-containing protein [Synergistaceae bacterium]|nr:CDGSH iron-sulfur domain-containing protein [Synergistaceae bacterium]